jgi:hypothetical protein
MKLGSINQLANMLPGFSNVMNAIQTIKNLLQITETNITGFNFGSVTVTISGCGYCPNGDHVSTYKVKVNVPKNNIILTPLQYSYTREVHVPFFAKGGVKLYVAVKSDVDINEITGDIYFAICDNSVTSVNGKLSRVSGGAKLNASLSAFAEIEGQIVNYTASVKIVSDVLTNSNFSMSVLVNQPDGVDLQVTGGFKFAATVSGEYIDFYDNSKKFSFKYNLDKKSDTYSVKILR